MKKYLPHILASLFVCIVFLSFAGNALAQEQSATSTALTTGPKAQDTGFWSSVGQSVWSVFDLSSYILAPIGVVLVKLVSYITMLSGVVLNASIYYTIVEMSKNVGELGAINTAWTTIRDIANMGFIFMLIYAAIMTIVGRENGIRGLVVKMVIAAILVNFSLFFTKVIIDVANLLALTFYGAIVPEAATTIIAAGQTPNFMGAGLSNSLINVLGATKLWQSAGNLTASSVFIATLLSTIALLVTAFIFFAMSIMFIVRYIALIFVLILSPLMVLSMVFPGLNDYTKKWKDTLVGQAFFAPVFFILMWITIGITTELSEKTFRTAGESIATAFNGAAFNPSAVNVLLSYAVILGFLIATMKVSKSISDKAVGAVGDLTKWAMGAAGTVALGGAGFAARGTIGRGAAAIAERSNLKEAASKSGVVGMGARLTLAASRKTAGSSFDARSSRLGKALGEQSGLSLGKGSGDKGFTEYKKKKAEEEEKYVKSLAPSDEAKREAEIRLSKITAKFGEDSPETLKAKKELDDLKGVSKDDMEKREKAELKKDSVVKSKEDLEKMEKELSEKEKSDAEEIKKKEEEIANTKIPELRSQREEELKTLKEIKKKEIEDLKKNFENVKKASEERTEEIKKNYREKDGSFKEVKSTGDIRKQSYADYIEKSPVAKMLGYNMSASVKIRDKKKKVEDLVKDALKASGEMKEEEKKPEDGGGEPKKA